MTTTHRPLTFNERFFEELTIVNVPYNVPPEKLPEISIPKRGPIVPAPDPTLSHLNTPAQQNQLGKFIAKNWLPIVGVATGILLIHLVYKMEQEKKQKNKQMATTV